MDSGNLSIIGTSRLAGVSDTSIVRGSAFGSEKLAKFLTARGVEASAFDFAANGLAPEQVILILEYFGYHARQKSQQAQKLMLTFGAIGIKAALERLRPQQPQPTPVATLPIDHVAMFQHAANAFAQQQRQIDDLSDRITQIEANKAAATEQLRSLPPAEVATPLLATRRAIMKAVNLYCQQANVDYRTAWNQLYQEFYLRCGVAIKKRKHFGNETHLDVAVRIGYCDQLYAIALDLFGLKPVEVA